ncbi:hypothetical protein IC582_013055 [Cucumis melo]
MNRVGKCGCLEERALATQWKVPFNILNLIIGLRLWILILWWASDGLHCFNFQTVNHVSKKNIFLCLFTQ